MQDAYPAKASRPEVVAYDVRGEGGSAAVTQLSGAGVTLTRTGTGAYLLTFKENPGTFVSALSGLQASTPGALAGHTVVFDDYVASTYTLPFVVYNASDAAHDLAADEFVNLCVRFARSAVAGA